ncbi:MAG: uracil-DNA glycosylase [Mariprofundaceae bacterium]|nr:uracil-DNA glycosylase [Mariprofundaceae bacterium]
MTCFNPECQRCPRLVDFLGSLRKPYHDYFCAPVPAFGDVMPKLLIVGLAPGMHGANRTGRPFTGDFAGVLLYQTLYDLGLASLPTSKHADDGLQLFGVRITNAVKCLPPKNKPIAAEIHACNDYLQQEITCLANECQLLALGKIAHDAVLKSYGERLSAHVFSHAAAHTMPDGRTLFDSYHCSRYNTQTRRLTPTMFYDLLAHIDCLVNINNKSMLGLGDKS